MKNEFLGKKLTQTFIRTGKKKKKKKKKKFNLNMRKNRGNYDLKIN